KLDAIVLETVVGGTDHNTGLCTKGSGQIGNSRRRHWPQHLDINTGGRKSGFQCSFKHVAGNTGILANQNLAASATLTNEHLASSPAQLEHKIGGNRVFPNPATNTIGAKIAFFCTGICPHSLLLACLVFPRASIAGINLLRLSGSLYSGQHL